MNMKKICMFLALLIVQSMVISARDMFPVRQLTTDPTQDGFATWSSDGRSVVYQYSDMYDDTLNKNGLWKVSVDGTGVKQSFKMKKITLFLLFLSVIACSLFPQKKKVPVEPSETSLNNQHQPEKNGFLVIVERDPIKTSQS
jgi:hypothetical protein